MTEFNLIAVLMLVLAALFVVFPRLFSRRRGESSLRASNVQWYRLRERELAGTEDAEGLLEETRLRLLEDEVDHLDRTSSRSRGQKQWLWLLPLVIISVFLYRQLGSADDVLITRELDALAAADTTAEDYAEVMQRVQQRVLETPENLHYQAMLGRYFMSSGEYGRASRLYMELVEQAPGDAAALALAAQAGYLDANRQLAPETQALAERALAIDPHQSTALGLLGMSAYERGQYRAAISYWRRLVAMQDPASEQAQMIEGIIARAEMALGSSPELAQSPGSAVGEEADQGGQGLGVTVTLQLAQGSTAAPGDSVFVFARDPESGTRMPVAVQRLTVSDLPTTLTLNDAASMAGQKISALKQVLVVARVSPSGQPGEEFATLQASLGPLAPEIRSEPRLLELKPKKI